MNELDIFGDHTFKGKEGSTVCSKLLVEESSKFTPENVKFEKTIKIGRQSILNIIRDKKVEIKGTSFELFYSMNNYGNQEAPISIESSSSGLKDFIDGCTSIIKKIDEGSPLPQDEIENFTIAEFKSNDEAGNKEACDNFKFTDSEGFKGLDCVKDGQTNYKKIAQKSVKDQDPGDDDDDGGLSAGAIAGIVIACVVVVAAIIALLVYFLVIKKKNQSTTSTQGDSSIAI